ncbi:thymidine phosphorylase [Kosmotoga arenicorallina S304]|uniref:Thymidine phosphorylase n=1 Tax=Kosmotoga arenicorallina S304 TaxID=1453497 RepID=A0A182C6Z7_9BACT|nr:pyrimidine-nucleoside phosphorylase [Kosmotoga arenicorallina]OAA31225.1 thymidine phosphorylase [Kosmotoga arenicorallina S304]
MRIYDVILKKRDGYPNTKEEIKALIDGYVKGEVPDYQVSAWLMAIFFNHMTDEERSNLTEVILNSGERIDLSSIKGIKVDKHSTGGVGDKVTLVLGPIVASLGLTFAKLSGRGLGHTGGTVDKLESIPGFRTTLEKDEFFSIVNDIGIAVAGQTANIAPADKKLYALRDVTATVDEISLIASSIMGKKLAVDSDVIVLDVKTGSGAFMKKLEDAKALAIAMLDIGKRHGRKMSAVVSDMNQPLGNMVGNALEVKEAIETLKGKGPDDLFELTVAIAERMVILSEIGKPEKAREMIHDTIKSGKALKKLKALVEAQGGNPEVVDDPERILPSARYKFEVKSPYEGFVESIDAQEIGISAMILGAGREKKEDGIDPAVGVEVLKKVGDRVQRGEPLAVIYANDINKYETAERRLLGAYRFSKTAVQKLKLIHEIF